MDTKQNIPQREIGDEEDELLEQLWSRLPDSQGEKEASDEYFRDLQHRIQTRLRARRRLRIAAASGIAAALITGILLWQLPWQAKTDSEAIAQLREMGVSVASNQVVLKMDNDVVMSLDSVASIEQKTADDLELRTSAGDKLALSGSRILKLEVPAGKRFQMTLSDGTQVWLNASSTLEYPASFEGKAERRVKLTGEAFFEVRRNEKCPFYVEIGERESIRVLGTSFNVNAYPESDSHVTTLVTGQISYCPDEHSKDVILNPDQQLRFDCLAGETKVLAVDASAFTSWKEGWIYFEDERLPELARRLSRMYGIEIQVSERLKDYSFSGKISYERGVDYITRLMSETTGIVCEVENGVILLK